jgi:hypothetical protein
VTPVQLTVTEVVVTPEKVGAAGASGSVTVEALAEYALPAAPLAFTRYQYAVPVRSPPSAWLVVVSPVAIAVQGPPALVACSRS